jgi:hypothetical protein
MAKPIYKQFNALRTALLLLFAGFFLGFSLQALAEIDKTYTVEGVEVDVTDKNAVKAREKALDEAQVKAFGMLVERFLGPEEAKTFQMPDAVTVSGMVQDFEVTKEQASKVRYKGVYTVRFRPNAVKNFMGSRGKAVNGATAKPVLVLPFYRMGEQTLLWSDANPWMRAWRALPSGGKGVVPLGDAEDITAFSDDKGLDYDPLKAQELAARYNAEDIAIAVASAQPLPSGLWRVEIGLYKNGFEGPALVQNVSVDQSSGEGVDALFTRAAEKLRGILSQDWKANAAYTPGAAQPGTTTTTTTVTTYGQPQYAVQQPPIPYTRPALGPVTAYTIQANFSSVEEWVRMKNALDRAYGMQSVMIRALKPREALLDVRFAGNAATLQSSLRLSGIELMSAPNGVLVIRTVTAIRGY